MYGIKEASPKNPFGAVLFGGGSSGIGTEESNIDVGMVYDEALRLALWLNERWPKERGWVSVDDELPPVLRDVWATNGTAVGRVYLSAARTEIGPSPYRWFLRSSGEQFFGITHWMPFPNLPSEDKPCDCGCEQERVCGTCFHWGEVTTWPGQVGFCHQWFVGTRGSFSGAMSPVEHLAAGSAVLQTTSRFGCNWWKQAGTAEDRQKRGKVKPSVFAVEDIEIIRDIVREELEDALRRLSGIYKLRRSFHSVPKDDETCSTTG